MNNNTNQLIPKLRFPEFKDNGEWEEKKLGDKDVFINFLRGSVFSKADISEKGINQCIHYGELFTQYKEVITKIVSKTNCEGLILSCVGDILMPSSDVTPNGLAKASALMLDNVVLGGDMNILRVNKKCNSIFLSYLINYHQKAILKLVTGSIIKHIYISDIKTLDLTIAPSLKEQQKIADCLTSLDDLIVAQEEKVQLLQDHKKGLMQNLFPKEGQTKPKYRFPEFENEEDWEEKKLDSLTTIISDGIHTTPNYDDVGDYFFVNGNNLLNGKISLGVNTKRINNKEYNKHKKELNDSTILLSINGTIGNIAFYNNEKVLLGKSACYINIKPDLVNKYFIAYQITSNRIKRYFESELTGAVIKNLSLKSIKDTLIYVPSIKEQQKIAECLLSVDNLIEAETNRIEELKQHKKGLMQGLFPTLKE